jgi:ABC-2 type transport system ATP-binding protein
VQRKAEEKQVEQSLEPVIKVSGLVKRFDEVEAVSGIDFEVQCGELFGFLGPNGAGKTTTINMLTGLARPDAGNIRIAGIDCTGRPKAAQHLMGIVADESNLYPELTGFENLSFCGALYGMFRQDREARARQLLEHFALTDASDRKFAGYSRGMKRKLAIAAGLIHEPPILFLDEPTTGIDVASARQIRQLIARMNEAGTTVFLTTHYIEEAERLCGRIAFIVSGRIVRIDTVKDLMQPVQGKHKMVFLLSGSAESIRDELSRTFAELDIEATAADQLQITSQQPLSIGPLVRFFEEHGLEVAEARKVRPSLEDIFVRVTGIEAAAMKREREKAGAGK